MERKGKDQFWREAEGMWRGESLGSHPRFPFNESATIWDSFFHLRFLIFIYQVGCHES